MDYFLTLSHLLSALMLSNSSFSICIGERGGCLFVLISSSINQGVADIFSAVLRVSLSLGDMFKLLLSNSGFLLLLPFSVFR